MNREIWDADVCRKAAKFAAEAHSGQTMLGSDLPYLLHVSSVAFEVAQAISQDVDWENGTVSIACAWLHDTIEDTATTSDDISSIFGSTVADGVLALTKDSSKPKAEAMRDSIELLKLQPPHIQAVKLADRIVNLEPPPANWSTAKRLRYAAEAEAIQSELGPSSKWLSERLGRAIDRYSSKNITNKHPY